MMLPFGYVTYDPDTGALTGSYIQELQPEHAAHHIAVDEEARANWLSLRANAARDGLEALPPADPIEPGPAPVPYSVTRRQARQALLIADLLDNVPAAIEALDDGTPAGNQRMRMAQIEWEDSLEFVRSRPLVVQIGAALGLDAGELDQLFVTASTL